MTRSLTDRLPNMAVPRHHDAHLRTTPAAGSPMSAVVVTYPLDGGTLRFILDRHSGSPEGLCPSH
jgi:hypothetical protein